MIDLEKYPGNSIGIINGMEYKNELQYSVNYYNSIEDYSGNDDLTFWVLEKGEDSIKVKIILDCIDKNSYSCIFDIERSEIINFFIGIVSILVEPIMVGMDIFDVETLMNRSVRGIYCFDRSNINDTTEKIVNEILEKFNNKAQGYNFNRYLIAIRGDVSLMDVNDIVSLIDKSCNSESYIIFNSIYDKEMEGIVDLYLYGMQNID